MPPLIQFNSWKQFGINYGSFSANANLLKFESNDYFIATDKIFGAVHHQTHSHKCRGSARNRLSLFGNVEMIEFRVLKYIRNM